MNKIFRIISSKVISMLLFIGIMLLLNGIRPFVANPVFSYIVDFFNENFFYLLILTVVIAIAEVFFVLPLPLNLPAPVFAAIGAVLVTSFIFRIFGIVDLLVMEEILSIFSFAKWIVYFVVFFVVLIVGYAKIFLNLFGHSKHAHNEPKTINIKRKRHARD